MKNRAEWCPPGILTLGRREHRDREFEARLGYVARSKNREKGGKGMGGENQSFMEKTSGDPGGGERRVAAVSRVFFFHFQKVEIFVTIVMIWKEKRKKWKSVIFRKTTPKSLSTTHLCWAGSLDYAEFTRSKPRKAEQYSVFLSHFLTYKTRLYELRL